MPQASGSASRTPRCGSCHTTLVVATCDRHSYFGHDAWAAFALSRKTVEDAISIRRRILPAFARAETEDNPADRERLLTFVIVGDGPTGVEMAGSVTELAQRITRDFNFIDPMSARIMLGKAGPRLLPTSCFLQFRLGRALPDPARGAVAAE